MNLLIFGCGYSATAFAQSEAVKGALITGTTRDVANSAALQARGITPVVWPGTDMRDHLAAASHLLISIAPDEDGDRVIAEYRESLTAATNLKWVGYLSTTAVYGDHDGGWVDEVTATNPSSPRGKWRVKAEQQWLDLHSEVGLPVHVFRLAGIYGPGRGPFAKLRKGTARRIIKENQVFSRIHVDDIAATLAASIAKPNPGAIYNVCDNDPAPPEDVIALAADLLGIPAPPPVRLEDADLSAMARSFYADSKRVSNKRIRDELGVNLRYPDYDSGLRAILKAES